MVTMAPARFTMGMDLIAEAPDSFITGLTVQASFTMGITVEAPARSTMGIRIVDVAPEAFITGVILGALDISITGSMVVV